MTEKLWRIVFLLLPIAVMTVHFGYNGIENYKHKKIDKQAENKAICHIENKYGFTPDSARALYNDETKLATVEIIHNNKRFWVAVDLNSSSRCIDDYQYYEIRSEIIKSINADRDDIIIAYQSISWSSFDSEYLLYTGHDVFYDGTNLEKFMDERLWLDLTVLAYGENASDFSDLTEAVCSISGDLDLICFDTKEHMEEFYEKHSSDIILYNAINPYCLEYYAPHINDIVKIKDGVIVDSGNPFVFNEIDGLKYCIYERKKDALDVPIVIPTESIITENTKYNVFERIFGDSYKFGKYLEHPLSKEYSCEKSDGEVWIYVPIDKFNSEELENMCMLCTDFGGKITGSDKPKICGDYAVFRPDNSSIIYYFMFVDTSE